MKKNNRKGFTLIELLAVIIVLALILVFAIPAVLDTSTRAQKKAFATYARKVLTLAQEYVETRKLDGAVDSMAFMNVPGGAFTLGSNDSQYSACIEYDAVNGTYKMYMFNDTYYVGDLATPAPADDTDLKDSGNVEEVKNVGSITLSVADGSSTCSVSTTK